jgi:hypothetical protein
LAAFHHVHAREREQQGFDVFMSLYVQPVAHTTTIKSYLQCIDAVAFYALFFVLEASAQSDQVLGPPVTCGCMTCAFCADGTTNCMDLLDGPAHLGFMSLLADGTAQVVSLQGAGEVHQCTCRKDSLTGKGCGPGLKGTWDCPELNVESLVTISSAVTPAAHFAAATHEAAHEYDVHVCIGGANADLHGDEGHSEKTSELIPRNVKPGAQWKLVAMELPGTRGTDALRTLEIDTGVSGRIRLEWEFGSGEGELYAVAEDPTRDLLGMNFAEFDPPPGVRLFGDFIDPNILVSNVETSEGALFGSSTRAWFCKMCSKSNPRRFGETCWGLLPLDEANRDCGCNSESWAGVGIFYAGYSAPECNTCGCTTDAHAFTGPALDYDQPKSGPSVGLRVYVLVTQEWALSDLGAVVSTASYLEPNMITCDLLSNLISEFDICGQRFQFEDGVSNGLSDKPLISIDLGKPREVNRIGAVVRTASTDDLWQSVRVDVSLEGQNWYEFGESDAETVSFISHEDAQVWATLSEPVMVQHIRYQFRGTAEISRLMAQRHSTPATIRPRAEPFLAVDIDDAGQFVISGTAAQSFSLQVEGSPVVATGPFGSIDAIQFTQIGDAILLSIDDIEGTASPGITSPSPELSWTVDCYVNTQKSEILGVLGVLVGQVIDRSTFESCGINLAALSNDWHRITISQGCSDDETCSTVQTKIFGALSCKLWYRKIRTEDT